MNLLKGRKSDHVFFKKNFSPRSLTNGTRWKKPCRGPTFDFLPRNSTILTIYYCAHRTEDMTVRLSFLRMGLRHRHSTGPLRPRRQMPKEEREREREVNYSSGFAVCCISRPLRVEKVVLSLQCISTDRTVCLSKEREGEAATASRKLNIPDVCLQYFPVCSFKKTCDINTDQTDLLRQRCTDKEVEDLLMAPLPSLVFRGPAVGEL